MRLDFGLWRPHENRVSKTRFIILINTKEEPRPRRTQRKKNQKQRKKNPGQAAHRARPRSCALCPVCDPGQAARCAVTQADQSRQRATQVLLWCSGFFSLFVFFFFFVFFVFFFFFFFFFFWVLLWYVLGRSPLLFDLIFPPFDLIVVFLDFLKKICVFWLVRETWDLKFF